MNKQATIKGHKEDDKATKKVTKRSLNGQTTAHTLTISAVIYLMNSSHRRYITELQQLHNKQIYDKEIDSYTTLYRQRPQDRQTTAIGQADDNHRTERQQS